MKAPRRRTVPAAAGALAALVVMASSPQPDGWLRADPDYEWSFPRDHGPHSGYKTEWWYFTGFLEEGDEQEPTLGYQFTIFKVGIVAEEPGSGSTWATSDVLMGHMAVTDLVSGTHEFREVLYRASPPLAGFGDPDQDLIAWSLAPPGTPGRWELERSPTGFHLSGTGAGLSLDLALDTVSSMVFQGPGGYSPKSHREGRASMYYSYTDLATQGTVVVGDATRPVSGVTWMDHEFSSEPLEEGQVGWDWLSLRLEDGGAVMAFQLRDASGTAGFRHLTLIAPDGAVRYPDPDEWSIEPSRPWTSPETGAAYPMAWSLAVPGFDFDLEISALHPSQENISERVQGLYYWEGAVRAGAPDGGLLGRGYLEMTGYGEGSRPAL